MFSPRSGWRRCAAPFDDSRLLEPCWLCVWSTGPWLYLAAVFGLVFSQPGFWLCRLDHHLLWQVAPLLSTLSVVWCPTVAMVGSGVVWWLGWVPVVFLLSAVLFSLLCLVAPLPSIRSIHWCPTVEYMVRLVVRVQSYAKSAGNVSRDGAVASFE